MNVQLILPRKDIGRTVDLGCYVIPQTLTQLAAVTPPEINLNLTDENLTPVCFDHPADLVGISVMTSQVRRAEEISREFKRRGSLVVWGGIHPTAVDQSENPFIDSFVVGEGERIWPQLLIDAQQERLQRRYRDPVLVDLNAIPLPRRELLAPDVALLVESPIVSRGCIYSCEHCSIHIVYGSHVRTPSVDRIVEDIQRMRSPVVAFGDENFLNNRARGKTLAERLQDSGKQYWIEIDPRAAQDTSILPLLQSMGVRLVFIGFESIHAENFPPGKYVQPSLWRAIADSFHDYGIKIQGSFMVGMDHDDCSVVERTEEAVQRAGIDFLALSILTPYPGTRLYQRMQEEGRIIDREWHHYDLAHCVIKPKNPALTPEALEEAVRATKRRHAHFYQQLQNVFSV
jgi:radical SAM superfamily enzyme YgiQ (UPF0313 family)